MAFIEPMHCNKPNITYLLTYLIFVAGTVGQGGWKQITRHQAPN